MKQMKGIRGRIFRWAKLFAKAIGTVAILWYGISRIIVAYTDPSPEIYQAEEKVEDIDGYWFEMSYAVDGNTINFGGGAKILHILKNSNGKYQVKYSLDDWVVFESEFENRHGLLQANLLVPFGGGRKFMILKTDRILIFERRLYIRMGKVAKTVDLNGMKIFQVTGLDNNNKQSDSGGAAKPSAKSPVK